MTVREITLKHLSTIVSKHSPVPFPEDIDNDTMLDEFWLDSIAFTALLTALESDLGPLPPKVVEGIYYPETFGDLVGMYDKTN